ncbi:UDP-N-acetylglucosamine 2-epimerase [Pseudoalteromonas ostreae]|uniref:UDP-N-acetylglucosamine 2-epimerase n=1 Tax=Pseudoalteromonas ostreae TaxID=2774154 RepID=UPI001B390768|nr:UDP-N-acetylglucosamine 2-epimerase [Pseudoalteromonas ostreae]
MKYKADTRKKTPDLRVVKSSIGAIEMKKNEQTIMLFAADPGGANSIAVLSNYLQKQNYNTVLFARDITLKHLKNKGYKNVTLLDDNINQYDIQSIESLISPYDPSLLVTSTTGRDFIERTTWLVGNKLNVPTVAILDQWMNYSLRFLKQHYLHQHKNEYALDEYILPSSIIVMDESAKLAMVQEGLPHNIIHPLGCPYFDNLKQKAKRNKLIKRDTVNILFASEPITKIYGNKLGRNIHGYTEKTILRVLCEHIQALDKKRKIKLIIKPHPRESSKRYSEFLAKFDFTLICKERSVLDSFKHSDIVFGMSSTVLLEATIFNKPTLSLHLGSNKKSTYLLEQLNKTEAIRKRYKLTAVIKNLLTKQLTPYNQQIELTSGSACHEITKHIAKLIKLHN